MKLCVLRPPPPVEYLATAMSAGEESLYSVLLDRFRSLEASYSKLREQFDVVVQERSKGMSVALDAGWGCVPWYFSMRSPHRSVLELMGHAVYVCTASSGEIIYWNHSAQELYGWKDCEVLGQRAADLIEEEYNEHATKIMEKLSSGQSWSGQFRVKKRTGDIFLAIGTKSPLYEDGELVGIITVTSDAAVFNSITSENLKIHQNRANGLPRVKGLTLKKIQWHPPPKITSVPQIASSVSNLASKALLRRQGDDMCNASPSSGDTEKMPKTANVKLEKPKKLEAKPKFGLQIGNSRTIAKSLRMDESAFEFPQPSEVVGLIFLTSID